MRKKPGLCRRRSSLNKAGIAECLQRSAYAVVVVDKVAIGLAAAAASVRFAPLRLESSWRHALGFARNIAAQATDPRFSIVSLR